MNEAIQHPDDRADDDRKRSRFVWLSEAAMVAGSVIVFFGFLTILMRAYFPQGTSLIIDPDASILTPASWSGDVELGINADDMDFDELFAGEILEIQRRVQHRSSNTLTWSDANVGDKVIRNDAVQTFARSAAVVEVNRSSRLTMGENSLIVFDQQEADPFLKDRNSVLVMIDGELSGTLSGRDKSRFRFGVNLPNSDVTLQPRKAGDDVEFLISVNDDQTTTVNIHEGTAQIVGSDGTLRTIGDQQSVTIDPSGSKVWIIELAPAPRVTGPANDMAVTYRNVPQQIQFAWKPVAGADRYHLVIARDPGVSERVVDDDVVGTTFTHGALGPGTYYWHVRSRVGWSQSDRSAVQRLRVRQDLDPPRLEVD
ncbi:MAG: hypothetical protein ACE5KS_02910, partial [Woeseiaceae bacterium]